MAIDQIPHDIESEEAFLGSLLLWGCESTARIIPVSHQVKPSDFYRDKNSWVYQAILDLLREGMGVDMITVAHKLKSKNQLDESYDPKQNPQGLPTPAYFYHLLGSVSTSFHMQHYANIILDCSRRRQQMASGAKLVRDAFKGGTPPTPQSVIDNFGKL